MFNKNPYAEFLSTPKRKVFVSYHHANDQLYYNRLSEHFSKTYDIVHDNSLDRRINSNDCNYIIRVIQDNYIKGTSCTIVLCGADTCDRKFIDWEIEASLAKKHALVGVYLPTRIGDKAIVPPDRLLDNIQSEFAFWVSWKSLFNGLGLKGVVEEAVQHAESNCHLICNEQKPMQRNTPSRGLYSS